MIIIKYSILACIFAISIWTGISISKRFTDRVKELNDILRALNIFEEKIKFTYEPIPEVFKEISKTCMKNIGNIFSIAAENMKVMTAGEAWEKSLNESNTSLTIEDIEVLKGMAKMLGKTDLDGQVSEIQLTKKFLEVKIKDAEFQKNKNQKLYKTLGTTIGLTIVIILI